MRRQSSIDRAQRDAEFRRRVDEAKAHKRLSDIVGRHTKLKPRGREKVGLCPFHREKTPSFEVNDAKGFYHCHGCGAGGDHFRFLIDRDGMTFAQAYEALTGDRFPTVDPAELAKAREEDRAARQAAVGDAQFMWSRCGPIAGTIAERYLRDIRAITMPIPAGAVRFGYVPTSRDDNGRWRRPYPAVVFACTNIAGEVVGLQRVFLQDDGSDKRWGKRSKFSLGRPRGSVVRLSAGRDIVMCEGPEDGLSLAQECRDRAVWVALGTAMIPEVELPPAATVVTLAGQNDDAGRTAVAKASASLSERGVSVRTMFPDPAFKDWNDQLRGIRQ